MSHRMKTESLQKVRCKVVACVNVCFKRRKKERVFSLMRNWVRWKNNSCSNTQWMLNMSSNETEIFPHSYDVETFIFCTRFGVFPQTGWGIHSSISLIERKQIDKLWYSLLSFVFCCLNTIAPLEAFLVLVHSLLHALCALLRRHESLVLQKVPCPVVVCLELSGSDRASSAAPPLSDWLLPASAKLRERVCSPETDWEIILYWNKHCIRERTRKALPGDSSSGAARRQRAQVSGKRSSSSWSPGNLPLQ